MSLPLPAHDGVTYLACLHALHATLRPRAYLQIGAPQGDSMPFADCPTICVDPGLAMPPEAMGQKPNCHLFRMTSDEFFAAYDPTELLGYRLEIAYLDGTHRCENLLRDIISTEYASTPRSLILVHDCIPLDLHMATRDEDNSAERSLSVQPDWWTGDVWKTVHAIRHHRPDLKIFGFRAPPTGLVLIGNLAPGNRILADRYRQIVGEMHNLDHASHYESYLAWLQPRPTDDLGAAVVSLRS
jgi:hypothetical protein